MLVGVLALAATILWLYLARPSASTPAPADQAAIERQALQAAVARIAAQSRNAITPTSPSTVVDEPVDASDGDDNDVPTPTARPPEGYDFVPAPTQMTKAASPNGRPELEPPNADLDWLGASDAVAVLARQAEQAGRDWTFGWLRLGNQAQSEAIRASLQRAGGEVLGTAGNLARAKLPGHADDLRAISALPGVLGLGAVPKQRKLAAMPAGTHTTPAHEQIPVFITLMSDDLDGRWRSELESLGAVVGRFDPDIRAYAANVRGAALAEIAAADFVLAIDPVVVVRAGHDLAVPAMGADAVRTYSGSPGMFLRGGAAIPIGVLDSGLNVNHLDIASNRASICGASFLTSADPLADEADLWIDENGHGTHVTGTLAGNGFNDVRFAGMAPSVQHIRFAKVLGTDGGGSSEGVMSGIDYVVRGSGCAGGTSTAAVQPLIVNMSLSADGRRFDGRDPEGRKLDGVVWTHRQLYTVVQGNRDINGFSNYGAAKNTLAVGAVRNDGELATFSSLGPTADGRLAPQVVASGVQVHSVKGNGSADEYVTQSGTSMASPAVAGIAALLMDAVPAHRQQPALVRARLMASAIKPDAWLESPTQFPANNTNGPGTLQHQYGLGKASARISILNRNRADGWTSGSALTELADGEYSWQDIVVPAGASRLNLVLTWDEPPGESIGSAVLNDLDLWLDRSGDCGAAACGEQSSTSRKDNIEWIIVRNPPAGTYRAKVVAQRIYDVAPRAALAWTVIRGPATPTLQLSADKSLLNGSGDHQLVLSVNADGYVAAGTKLTLGCRDADGVSDCEGVSISELQAEREDGISIGELNGFRASNAPIMAEDVRVNFAEETVAALGEVAVGENQRVTLTVSLDDLAPSRAVRLYFTASAWNAKGASTVVDLVGDGGSRAGVTVNSPTNDDFSNAASIAGMAGEQPFDVLRATTEPGEIRFQTDSFSVAHSLWYSWQAPADAAYRFSASGARVLDSRIDILRGDRVTELDRLAFGNNGAAFFATARQRYMIRVAMPARNTPGTLRWSQGRPANDDFAAATAITGETGSTEGSILGAGMESGEWLGSAAATVWYRWTAPRSAEFTFAAQGRHNALVFVGDQVANLRLVSSFPSNDAHLSAQAGVEYRIAVAAADGREVEGKFTLSWYADTAASGTSGTNHLDRAGELPAQRSARASVGIDGLSNVQYGEPIETGVRTNWWTWQVPSTGRFTFRLLDTDGRLFRVAAFSGASMAELRLVGNAAAYDVTPEFTLNASAGERLSISLGFFTDDISTFELISATPTLEWAPTPANDGLAVAARISGASGAVMGNNQFATTEGDEPSRGLGHSSLWWDFEAPDTGAYRFETTAPDQTLTVYRRSGDGFDDLELVERGSTRLVFQAVAGTRYAIRVGSRGSQGGDFTLRWSKQGTAGQQSHTVPLFLAVDDENPGQPEREQRQGFVRIINRSSDHGLVRIHAVDDTGTPGQPATLTIQGNQTRHFNSDDLEGGNTDKGLTGAVGDGQGDWYLRLETDLDITVLAYARTKPGGFLTSLHDVVPCAANRCQVDVFNPASNRNQRSLLRIVNSGDDAATVTVAGKDDAGELPGQAVSFRLPPGAARTLTAGELENGNGDGLSGALGDGQGKWQLSVAADQAIMVMSLMESPTGHLTNLSTTTD